MLSVETKVKQLAPKLPKMTQNDPKKHTEIMLKLYI